MRQSRRPGFTLLEVLVSMCVFLIAIASILPLFAVATTSHKRGIDQSIMGFIAPRISARLQETLTTDRPKDWRDAEITYQGFTYKYDAMFAPLDPADPNRSAFIVRVVIKWNEAGRQRTESFDTILLRRLRW